jgi:protein involved in polysaccharide export with SLBB domain
MKTKVGTHEGVDINQVNVRGNIFYKSGFVFGEALMGKTIDEVAKRISTKHAQGDTRVLVQTHEGVNIYQVTEGSRKYFISDPLYDETITEDTAYEVAHQITIKHAIMH